MKVVVCIKPVKTSLVYPNESRLEELVINPYDLYALKKAVDLKKMKECQLICLCMGPVSAKPALQKAIAIGADDAVIVCDSHFQGSDTVATSYILAQAIKKIGDVSLILCGKRTIDGETGQVVYGISKRLGYPCMPEIAEIKEAEDWYVTAVQSNETEFIMGKLKLPAVVSFCDFMVTQPKVSLMGLKKARKKEIQVWNAEELEIDLSRCGLNGSKTKVLSVQQDIVKKEKSFLEGSVEEKAQVLNQLLLGKANRL